MDGRSPDSFRSMSLLFCCMMLLHQQCLVFLPLNKSGICREVISLILKEKREFLYLGV